VSDATPYQAPGTFMGVPAGADPRGSRVAVLGIPYDMGTHATRIGSRQGPDAIRAQSAQIRRYLPEFDLDPLAELNPVDLGNVRLVPSRIQDAFERIERAMLPLVEAGVTPLTMGGDGSVSLPQLRALHRRYPELAVLHFDAHTDSNSGDAAEPYTTATTFARAREEGLIDPQRTIHVGIRGSTLQPRALQVAREQGFEALTIDDVFERGLDGLLAHLHVRLAGRPVYLCWDMDFFDPAVAPGVCTPAWGGVTAREGIYLLRRLAGLQLVAFDVNTVSPPHDVAGMTAMLAARVMLECLFLACRGPGA
jgi:guanidinobutyrase